jgi:tetratricopeptide (TPR) repeat protein
MTKLSMSFAALMLAVAPFAFGSGSGPMSGGGDTGGMTSAPRITPQQMAVRSYNAGLKHKERAQDYEAKAAEAKDDKDKQKQLSKAKDQYEDSIDDYRKAIGYDNRAYQAMNELGFAYRKTGSYEDAVKAYNAALAVKSDFAPAIEYRGEAYLALSQFKQVQDSYLALVRADQDQAAALMRAMEAWLNTHQENSTADAKAFSDWVLERKAVAVNTVSLSTNNVRPWN